MNRKFVSLASTSGYRPIYRLYEVVLAGEVNLLRHERSTTANHHEIHGFRYIVRFQDTFMALRKSRSRIYPQLVRTRPKASLRL